MHKVYQRELAFASQSHLMLWSNYHCKNFDDIYLAIFKCISTYREHSSSNKTPTNNWKQKVKGRILIIHLNELVLWIEIGFFVSGP